MFCTAGLCFCPAPDTSDMWEPLWGPGPTTSLGSPAFLAALLGMVRMSLLSGASTFLSLLDSLAVAALFPALAGASAASGSSGGL